MFKAVAPVISMVSEGCGAVTTLFRAANSGARAIESLASVAEESAGAFADQSRADRQIKLAKLNSARAKAIAADSEVQAALAAPKS